MPSHEPNFKILRLIFGLSGTEGLNFDIRNLDNINALRSANFNSR